MNNSNNNPFGVTRAADFTDEQILQYWVDLSYGEGFVDLIQPRLEMPMLILGGKGSGKTHIMRYFSFPLQEMRYCDDLAGGVSRDGFVGIYMRCSGLNSNRFRGKGQSDETWADVFAYYMELWLSQLVVEICCNFVDNSSDNDSVEQSINAEIEDLFDEPVCEFPTTLGALGKHLRHLQRELDVAINNCGIRGELNVSIRVSPGRLIFGIPRVLSGHIPLLKEILFVYLIDEYENLTEAQQKHINTLIREKQSPVSFKIGSRLYGVRTYSTFCADEDNKEGSEYDRLPLDEKLRNNRSKYSAFAGHIVIRRLEMPNFLNHPLTTDDDRQEFFLRSFGKVSTDGLAEPATRFVLSEYSDRDRPYFSALRRVLHKGLHANASPGIQSSDAIETAINMLGCPQFPLLEKLNCFIFYQQWKTRNDLFYAAEQIRSDCQLYLGERDTSTKYHDKLLHWKYDLLAQLWRECGRRQQYAGFATLLELSWGNPRHLLILLKHIFRWAVFRDEQPFAGKPISIRAQSEGVREASDWFFRDARMTGKDRKFVLDAIGRLGTLFRSIRYSNKPSECSLSTFSYDQTSVSDETRRLIDVAEKHLLLVYVGGQNDRNSDRVDMKFQLNRMISPKWDISFSRRGALAISGDDLNTIFDPSYTSKFEQMLKARVDPMTAPFFGSRKETRSGPDAIQKTLFGPDND